MDRQPSVDEIISGIVQTLYQFKAEIIRLTTENAELKAKLMEKKDVNSTPAG